MLSRGFTLIFPFAVLLAFNFAKAQNEHSSYLLSGTLLDYETREPVPFANIVIEGSNVGTSSTETGIFYLAFYNPSKEYLKISSIGYSTIRLSIDSLLLIDSPVIFLRPSIIQLAEVLVPGRRLTAGDFVKEAVKSLDKNIYRKDYLLEWYSTMLTTDSATGHAYSLETVFDDYHINGKATQTIRHQRERGISPKLFHNPKDTICALVPWFEIGSVEIDKAQYGVLNLKNMDEFEFTYEGVLGLDGDSVYVVGYRATSFRYAVTSYTNKSTTHTGKLYITTENYAIVRHTLEWRVKAKKSPEWNVKQEILYKKINNYYFPYYIKSTRNLNISRNFQPFYSNTYILRNLKLDSIEYEAGYNWCDNRAPYGENFWKSNYPLKSGNSN